MKSKLQRPIEGKSETARRVRARLAMARCCLMNDTKWRELLAALSRSPNLHTPIRWSFVGRSQVYIAHVSRIESRLPNCLPDDLPYPYGPYWEIDWIEIPAGDPTGRTSAANDLAALTADLVALGQLPLTHSDAGLRIAGYTW